MPISVSEMAQKTVVLVWGDGKMQVAAGEEGLAPGGLLNGGHFFAGQLLVHPGQQQLAGHPGVQTIQGPEIKFQHNNTSLKQISDTRY